MEAYKILIDHNRHTYLQYRDNGKTRNYVSMVDGTIDCVQLPVSGLKGFKVLLKTTPEHFAQTYLNSHLTISRSARAVLRGVLGFSSDSGGENEGAGRSAFSAGTVGIQELAIENNWEPSHCRRFLRKTMDKPGGRWTFSPEEAQKVTNMLKEYFARERV